MIDNLFPRGMNDQQNMWAQSTSGGHYPQNADSGTTVLFVVHVTSVHEQSYEKQGLTSIYGLIYVPQNCSCLFCIQYKLNFAITEG